MVKYHNGNRSLLMKREKTKTRYVIISAARRHFSRKQVRSDNDASQLDILGQLLDEFCFLVIDVHFLS